jgi:hypothetical protein
MLLLAPMTGLGLTLDTLAAHQLRQPANQHHHGQLKDRGQSVISVLKLDCSILVQVPVQIIFVAFQDRGCFYQSKRIDEREWVGRLQLTV